MKKILVAAFDIDPLTGGENGMAWNFVNQVAMKHKVILLTQIKHLVSINKHLTLHPGISTGNITVITFDLPHFFQLLSLNSTTNYIYYFFWQLTLPRFVKKKKLEFDIVHNLSMNKDWTPSFLYKLKKPFVWGPIGHNSQIPANYLKYVYGSRIYLLERIKWFLKSIMWQYNPWLNKTIQNADSILVMNNSVEEVLSLKGKKVTIMPGVVAADAYKSTRRYNGPFRIISAGEFKPLAGFDIAIKSFANFYHRLPVTARSNVSLLLIGEGEHKKYLEQITSDLHLDSIVTFESFVSTELLRRRYAENLIMLSPSHELHMNTISEALMSGLPFICFENCGPGSLVDNKSGITLPYQNYRDTILSFSDALRLLYEDRVLLKELSLGARNKFGVFFDGNANGAELYQLYDTVDIKKRTN